MTDMKNTSISFDEFDDINYPRQKATDFDHVVETAVSRRDLLKGGIVFSTTAFITGASFLSATEAIAQDRFAFKGVKANTDDTITIPEGYSYDIVVRWGDPLWSKGSPFDHNTKGDGESQELAFGDNNDGMALMTRNGKTILVCNNEYSNVLILHSNRPNPSDRTADDVRKSKAAHGVSVCELQQKDGKWTVVQDGVLNRRITADTPMDITGPARGHGLMKTKADPKGEISLGTWNNCGNGETPWGTYLACEENFNGYFSTTDKNFKATDGQARYGVGPYDWGYSWAKHDERFDVAKHPNEANRVGYVVEIDPWDPKSTPKKRTALGRFKHENAEVVIAKDNRVVVYMGDDERGEFLYRFISAKTYSKDGNNKDLLEQGTLYAAKFDPDGTGQWLALTPETTKMASEAEICIHTRLAASAVHATTMDRPEWVAAHPKRAEIYCSLTNNKLRGVRPNKGGDLMPSEGPNPRDENTYGQIVRWTPENGDHTSDKFDWNLFVLAGNPLVHKDREKKDKAYAGSENITPENIFNSPDGLSFDSKGMLWIQTDGKYSNEGDFKGMGNNQMLMADPVSGEIRRFLVGPREAEVTGLCWSADKKTMFVGIQHPGEQGQGASHFPEGGDKTPRSCVIAVTRDDGKEVG